uniref:Glutathione transferase n=1 Tax=Attheya septentrionalis TaxID=420275 RepID=A0A7S2UCJ1_9STRA
MATASVSAAASNICIPAALTLVGRTSFRTFRNVWMLEELGVPYHQLPVSPWSAESKRYHPLGKVPSLAVKFISSKDAAASKNFHMYESVAINTYLGDVYRYGTTRLPVQHDGNDNSRGTLHLHNYLVPMAGTPERALYEQWVLTAATELDSQGLWIHRKHQALGKVFGHIPEAVQHAQEHFNKVVNQILLPHLLETPNHPYLLGCHFGAADILWVHCLDWAESIGWGTIWTQDTTNSTESGVSNQNNAKAIQALQAYLKRCRSRTAYLKTIAKREAEKQTHLDTMRSKI